MTIASFPAAARNFNKMIPVTLSYSKAAGISFIRVTQMNGDIIVEELDANQ